MYAQPMQSQDLVAARIADLRRQVSASRATSARVAVRRTSVVSPLPVRRRAGWWLVTVGLRLAVGGPTHSVRSAGAR